MSADRQDLIKVKDFADGEFLAVAYWNPAKGHYHSQFLNPSHKLEHSYDPDSVTVLIADVKVDGQYVDLKAGHVYTPIILPVSEEARPEPEFTTHYEEVTQLRPEKDSQSFSQASNLELANNIMNIIAPHWNKTVRGACADDIRGYLNQQLTRMFGDIIDFHYRYKLDYSGPPRALPTELDDFRVLFLAEELEEYAGVKGLVDWLRTAIQLRGPQTDSLELREDKLDALVDLVYVALGTAYLSGFNFAEAWRRVHRANMAKVRTARPSDSKRGSGFDVVKPEGWTAPSHKDLVGVMPKEPEEPVGTQHSLF